MNKRTSLFMSLLLITLITLTSCNFAFPGKQIAILPDDAVLEIEDPNMRRASAVVSMGKRLIIKIKGNLDSGYGWYIKNPGCKSILLATNLNSFNCGEFINNYDNQGRIINDGFYYFVFKPKRVGKMILTFNYRRPFQWDSQKNMKLNVSVRVMRNYFETDLLQDDKDASRVYKNYQRGAKQRLMRMPRSSKDHNYRSFKHNYRKFKYDCENDYDLLNY